MQGKRKSGGENRQEVVRGERGETYGPRGEKRGKEFGERALRVSEWREFQSSF